MRRSRRLVVSFIATVGNYEYGFYWYFYQDGTIQLEVKLTGIVSNGAVAPGETPRWGELVAPQVYGPIHQHFFNVRLDLTVDGPHNSVYEVNTVADAAGPGEPARTTRSTPRRRCCARKSEAQRLVDPLGGPLLEDRQPVGAEPPRRAGRLQADARRERPALRRPPRRPSRGAPGFMTKHLWVTRYDPRERYAAGDYPNQHPGGAGLPELRARTTRRSRTPTSWSGTRSAPTTSCGRRTGR